ncbi:MAG: PEP-CTERM sorting domain-containing protein, partial [Phycisphaerae bacterium]|nr:PEP-CTERM sorting domain-containing protein [Phycisphaerae bacterium]
TPASRADGDLDGDGVVGQSDYDEVLANWGSAPEPATMGLLLIGALATLLGRRKSLMIIVAAGCLALLGFPLSQAYAIDGDPEYDIDPITYYNPSTQATTNFFAIGWYVVRTETSPAEIAYAGGNTAAPSHQDGVTMADISDYLDQASTAGVKVLIRFLASEILDPAVATAWATEFVDHPALLGYQLGDENTHKADPWTAANVGAAAAAIRAVDPDRQIWQVFPGCCGPAAIEAYMNPGTPDMKTDVVSQDHYWVRSGPDHPPDTFANAQGEGNWASGPAHTRNVAAEGCTTYGWAGNVSLPQACDAPYGDYRFPTYKEHRWDCFSAIASSGARGNLNWLDVAGLKDNTFREGAARPVALEQLKMAHALATGWNAGTVKLGTLADDDYYHANYPEHAFHEASSLLSYDDVDDKYYLIVVNNDTDNKENMKIKLSSLPHAPVGLAPGAENFTISKPKDSEHFLLEDLGGGTYRFTDTLDNHEVGVYEILTADASWRWKAVTDPGCPTGYISYDFFVEVGDNLGAMELILATPSSGDIYKNTDTDIPDDPDDLFDTYVTIGSPGAGEQPANTEVFGGALSLGGAPGEETFTDQNIDIAWGPDGGVQTGSGEFHVARVTLKSGITATWSLMGLEFGGEPVLIAGASLFTPLPGDVDGDGFIDDNDLTIILNNWGKSGQGWFGGDLNSNGVVDGPDYAEVLSYWAPPAEPLEAAGVPEPLTLAILGIGSLLALIGRRRVVR